LRVVHLADNVDASHGGNEAGGTVDEALGRVGAVSRQGAGEVEMLRQQHSQTLAVAERNRARGQDAVVLLKYFWRSG
jgi:hypothetical protein